jgi:hypothetical protein
MADLMAVVSKAVFEKMTKTAKVGDVLPIDRYTSGNPVLNRLEEEGSRLFLFTVRPPDEQLWLVGVLGGLSFDGEAWIGEANSTPIADLHGVREQIQFESGVGLHAKPGALGMSLQTPRGLTAEDADLLLGAAGGEAPAPAPRKAAAEEDEGEDEEEGEGDEGDDDRPPPVWRAIVPKMTPVQKKQLAAMHEEFGDENDKLIEWYEIDDGGKHVYDAAIFVGDDGYVWRKGTTDVVAGWSQGGMSELMDDDESLEERLEEGFDKRGKLPKAAAVKKKPAATKKAAAVKKKNAPVKKKAKAKAKAKAKGKKKR